jgi:ribosome maturation factor RimP
MNWQLAIERTVTGLNYELVDVERSAAGLLRVFIDRLPTHSYADGSGGAVNVEDCERVTRQLQYVLEVEAVAYQRLEVSSPGLDRPLKREADYARFTGHEVNITLKLPFKGRKNYRGQLLREGDAWRLALSGDEQALDRAIEPRHRCPGNRRRPHPKTPVSSQAPGPDDASILTCRSLKACRPDHLLRDRR